MDAIYAMGACVAPPMDALSGFNFLGDKKAKSSLTEAISILLNSYKEIFYVLLICAVLLAGVYVFFQMQLKAVQKQYDQLSLSKGASV